MFKKNPNVLITVISFVIAVLGIVNNVFITTHDFTVMRYKDILNPFFLDWVFSGHSLNYNGHNYVDAIFGLLLLLGSIAFAASGYKQSGLIRFVFSIIFLSNAAAIIKLIILLIFKSYFTIWITHLSSGVLYYLINAFWLYLSLKTLKHLKGTKTLQQETYGEGEHIQSYFVRASNWQRILHLLVDIVVTIAVFSQTIEIFADYDSSGLSRYLLQVRESWAEKHIMVVIVGFRIIYYLLSESILGGSPAKYLTKTRVVDYEGEKPTFKNIIIRTLSRLVPFESFSFFTNDGWHDKWSETLVVKEE